MNVLISSFESMPDFRRNHLKRYSLQELIFISVCAVICGVDEFAGIEDWAKDQEPWLRRHLALPNGIASEDTFARVFQHLDPVAFNRCFIDFVSKLYPASGSEAASGAASEADRPLPAPFVSGQVLEDQISIDGKCLRGAKKRGEASSRLYMVNAWSSAHGLCLGQHKVEDKSNEITAIPELLDALVIRGCLVSIDAVGTQTDIAAKIIERKGNYLLAVKGNQPTLKENIIRSFEALTLSNPPEDQVETIEKGHGRIETRRCEVLYDLRWMETAANWPRLCTLVRVHSHRHLIAPDQTTTDTRYYICSARLSAAQALEHTRKHWEVENLLHWQLDVTFGEDASRKRERNAAQSYAMINRLALNLLRQHPDKRSIRRKRHSAHRNIAFLEQVLTPKTFPQF